MQLLETAKHEELQGGVGEVEGEWKESSPECLKRCEVVIVAFR
jgi:hypothetical protein